VSEGPKENISQGASGAVRPRRKRHRVRNTLLILLALLVLFHRPILIAIVHAVAIKVAAKQNIDLSLQIEGTIFTNISLLNIRALPNGKGPTPVQNISIDEVTVHYSIPALVRKGFSEFLSSYVLRNAYIVVKPVAGSTEQKSDLASTLHGLIQQPALFSNHVELDNLNLVADVPDGEFAVKGLNLLLDPVQPGALDIALLQIPRVRTWHDLHATSSYANRDMILNGLEIDPQLIVQRLELDASQRAQGVNRLDVHGTVFGGDAQFSLLVRELPGKHANNVSNASAQIDATLTNLSIEKVTQYFHASAPGIGTVKGAGIHLTGDPNTPSSWDGSLYTEVGTVHAGGVTLDKTDVRLDVSKGWATFGSTLFSGSDSVTAQASGKLPDTIDGFAGAAISGWFDISGKDLHHLAAPVTSGSMAGDGTFDVRDNTVRADVDIKASAIAASTLRLAGAEVKVHVTKHFPAPATSGSAPDVPPFVGLQTQVSINATAADAGAYAVDSANLAVDTNDAVVRLGSASIRRADNALSASGTYTMPADMKSWITAPATLDFALNAPSIAAFNAKPGSNTLDGRANIAGTLANGADGYGGVITADVSALKLQDFAADGLKANITIARGVATINTLTFALNPTDGFSATGHAALQAPYAYDGSLQARIRDLSKFKALASGLKGALGGALQLAWSGQGDLSTLRSTGSLNFALTNGLVQDVKSINLAIDGTYSPEQLSFPTFTLTSSKGGLSAVIAATNNQLRVDQITATLAGRPLITGSLSIPLDLRNPADSSTLIPMDGPIAANLVSSDVAIESLFPAGNAPASGIGKVSVAARGSINQPDVRVVISGRSLKAKTAATLAPATLDADFTLLGTQLSLKARVAQPDFSPVEIAGTIPLPLQQIVRRHQIDPNSPVQLSVRVPRTSVSVVTRFVPAIRYLQGTAEASVDVAGTVGKPQVSGVALLDLPAIRFSNPDLPSVNGFRGDLRFAGDQFTIRQLSGQLSGGTFMVGGSVVFKDTRNPTIDIRMQSRGALVLRNDSVTVRADSNVRIAGPLASASVTGDIGITQSRFFKQIEILPLELPGRAPPPPPPPAPPSNPSIDTPPLRDWKFALKIHTKDPFKIHGNLANGSALVDLSIGGTGKAPTLDGTVRIENFVASLPFSQLNITNGTVYFTKDDPFVPQLNIQATCNMQDYNINVYIYGTASDPKTVMSSEPPLRQEDIVSLLATGATTSNLNSGTGIAGRAAVLLLQSAYHKVFKAKPVESTNNESFSNRFKVDVGGVDARTGQQEINSSFRLNKQLYLVGDIDVGGDLRGMVRYLIRFK
jgi:hypothetical protein